MTAPKFVTKFLTTVDEIYDDVLKFIKMIVLKFNKFVDTALEAVLKAISDVRTIVISALLIVFGLDLVLLGKIGVIDFTITIIKTVVAAFAGFNTAVLIILIIALFLYLYGKKH